MKSKRTVKAAMKTEGVKRLKDHVLCITGGGEIKVLQLVCSVSGEGMAEAAIELAVQLGINGRRVLLIDLDFANAKTGKAFNLADAKGLKEYVEGDLTPENIINKTAFAGVDVITRGGAVDNSSLVLLSEKFGKLVKTLRGGYDVILAITAPVLEASDYMHVAKFTDAAIFFAAFGRTKKAQVKEAVGELKERGVKLLGSVYTYYNPKKSND